MRTKTIVLFLLLMMGANTQAQDCKPYKKVQDDFLDKEINYYGANIGVEGSLTAQTITSILVSKQDNNTYTLIYLIKYNDSGGNLAYVDGTSFEIKTEEGVKTYTSTFIKDENITMGFEVCELSLTVSKKEIEYLRDNKLLKYQITSISGVVTQGEITPSKASKFKSQMTCILNDTYNKVDDAGSTNDIPTISDVVKMKEPPSIRKNEISFMFGNSQLDYLGEGNIRIALVGSYTKRISNMLSVGLHVGVTRSKLVEEDSYEDYDYDPITGGYEWVTTTDNYIYKTDRTFIGPKVSLIAYETDKFQLFGSAGVSITRYRDTEDVLTTWNDGSTSPSHEVTKKIVFNYDLYAGASYFFNQHFGLTATVGIGISRFRFGFSYQF